MTTTTPVIERAVTEADVASRLEAVDRRLSQLEGDLRDLWHHLVADEPALAARVRIAANHLRNAASTMCAETLI